MFTRDVHKCVIEASLKLLETSLYKSQVITGKS